MIPRDTRWEHVYGHIGRPEIRPWDLETGYYKVLETKIEVVIEVVYKGQRIYSKYYLDELAIADLVIPNIWAEILNEEVRQLDEALAVIDQL